MQRIINRWAVVGMAVAGLPAMLRIVLPAGLMLASVSVRANNVVVTNTILKAPAAGKVQVQFDLSWDNSWRDGVNYDACWVFVKYSTNSGTNWSHATLGASGTNPAGFTCGSGTNLEIVVPEDKTGAFIQRSVEGTGTVANTGVQLAWDFASNGVSKLQRARVNVFAIEMVYVAQGAFYVGDGSTNEIAGQFENGTSTNPLLITGEGQLILGGGGAGSLGNNNADNMALADDFNDTTSKTLPVAFPKGFAAFYMMKTSISQRQYCNFLNTLTYNQQTNLHNTNLYFNLDRNFIKKTQTTNTPAYFGCDANDNAGPSNAVTDVSLLNETNDAGWVACNYLLWTDQIAYYDWAALRPYTELEFEKACRGTNSAVAKELSWGATNFGLQATSLTSSNTASETPNQGNCNYGNGNGSYVYPYRVGCHAIASSSSRTNAGAGYYGALDLSSIPGAYAVTVCWDNGRKFTGAHGDGNLTTNGKANVTNWTANNNYNCGAGYHSRNDGYKSRQRVSGRWTGNQVDGGRWNFTGGRGARTAPASIPSPGGSHDVYFYGGSGDSCASDQSPDGNLLAAGTIIGIW